MNERGLFSKYRAWKERRNKAEERGNDLVRKIEGRILENVDEILPKLTPESTKEAYSAFWHTDPEISPDGEKIWSTINNVMEELREVNPELAEIIDEYDAHDTCGQRPAAYSFTMILAALTHPSIEED